MGARAVEKQSSSNKGSSGLRQRIADEPVEVDDEELLDTAEFKALAAAEEARARAGEDLRPSRKKAPRPNEAMTVRVDADAGTRATVPAPEHQRRELRALRRETLDRISAEKRASRPDLGEDAASLPLVLAAPAEIPAAEIPAAEAPAAEAIPPPITRPRKSARRADAGAASDAETLPLANLRIARDEQAEPATVPLEKLRVRRAGTDAAPEAPRASPPWGRVVAVAVVAAVMFVVGRWVTSSSPPGQATVDESTPRASPRAATPEATPPVRPESAESVVSPASPQDVVAAAEARPTATPSGAAAAPLSNGKLPGSKSVSTPVAATATPAPAPETASTPTKGLDAAAASSALSRAGARAARCTDPKGGQGSVSVTFDPDGSATHVTMSGPYEGTAVASCVLPIFRSIQVPPFEGTPSKVFYTVKLPGDGTTMQ